MEPKMSKYLSNRTTVYPPRNILLNTFYCSCSKECYPFYTVRVSKRRLLFIDLRVDLDPGGPLFVNLCKRCVHVCIIFYFCLFVCSVGTSLDFALHAFVYFQIRIRVNGHVQIHVSVYSFVCTFEHTSLCLRKSYVGMCMFMQMFYMPTVISCTQEFLANQNLNYPAWYCLPFFHYYGFVFIFRNVLKY